MDYENDVQVDPRDPFGAAGEDVATHGPGRADALPDRFTVTIDRRARRPVVVVTGELDASGASLLEAVVDHVTGQGAHGPVLVDLGAVCFADTHGLAPVLDGTTEVRAASPVVRRLLRLLGLPEPRRAESVLRG